VKSFLGRVPEISEITPLQISAQGGRLFGYLSVETPMGVYLALKCQLLQRGKPMGAYLDQAIG